jgi:hypothetical protein
MIPPLDRASRGGFNGGLFENRSFFDRDDQFFARQMVNFSSLHDEGRPADVFYHHRRDTLVNALRMVVLSLILAFHTSTLFSAWLLGGKLSSPCFHDDAL